MKVHLASMLLFLGVLSSAVQAGGGPDLDPETVARTYLDARQSGLVFPDLFGNGQQFSDKMLYEVQRKFVELQLDQGLSIGGYKGGFIPKASVGGVLFAEGLLKGSPTLQRSQFQNLVVEAEIAFQFCGPVGQAFEDVATLKAQTCNVYPAVELPDAAVDNLEELLSDFVQLRQALIPINMAVAKVLLGEGKNPRDIDLDHLDVSVFHDGTRIGYRDGVASDDDIWSRVLWVVNDYILRRGYKLGSDHIIIPGALTGLHPSNTGQYRVDYGSLGAVEFRISP